jgi:hypothetical protein
MRKLHFNRAEHHEDEPDHLNRQRKQSTPALMGRGGPDSETLGGGDNRFCFCSMRTELNLRLLIGMSFRTRFRLLAISVAALLAMTSEVTPAAIRWFLYFQSRK